MEKKNPTEFKLSYFPNEEGISTHPLKRLREATDNK